VDLAIVHKGLSQIWLQGQKGFLFVFGALLYLFWRHATSYGLNMANSTLFCSKYGNFGHFFPTKTFVGF
jgi:hypothetical protein